jgi:hypothetical protein
VTTRIGATAHPFVPDPDLPPDHNGRRVCAACHLLGRPGDAHHNVPDAPPEQDEHRRRAGDHD